MILQDLLAKGLVILAGYLAAAVAATVVTEALFFTPQFSFGVSDLWSLLLHLPQVIVWGLFVTATCALPGFLVAITAAALLRWRYWLTFSVLGSANAIAAIMIFSAIGGGTPFDTTILFVGSCLVGGFAGGFVYWKVAGGLVHGVPA